MSTVVSGEVMIRVPLMYLFPCANILRLLIKDQGHHDFEKQNIGIYVASFLV